MSVMFNPGCIGDLIDLTRWGISLWRHRNLWVSLISFKVALVSLATSVPFFYYSNIAKHHDKSMRNVLMALGVIYIFFFLFVGTLILAIQEENDIDGRKKEAKAKRDARRDARAKNGLGIEEEEEEQVAPPGEAAQASWCHKRVTRFITWLKPRRNCMNLCLTLSIEISVFAASSTILFFMSSTYTDKNTGEQYNGYDENFLWSLFAFCVHSFSTIVFLKGCFLYDFILGVSVLVFVQEATFLQHDNKSYPFPLAIVVGATLIVGKGTYFYLKKKKKEDEKARLQREIERIEAEVSNEANLRREEA